MTKILKLLLLVGSSVKSVHSENSSIDRVKTVTSERRHGHMLHYSVKRVTSKNKLLYNSDLVIKEDSPS